MAKIRNKWGEDRHLVGFGLVEKDATFEVPDAAVEGLVCQPGWEPADAEAEKVASGARKDRKARTAKAD